MNLFKKPNLLHPLLRRRYEQRLRAFKWAVLSGCLVIASVIALLFFIYYPPIKNLYRQVSQAQKSVQSAENHLANQELGQAGESLGLAKEQLILAGHDLDKIVLPGYLGQLAEEQKAIVRELLAIGVRSAQALEELAFLADDLLKVFQDEDIELNQITPAQKKEILQKLFESPPLLQGIKAKLDLSLISLEQAPIDFLVFPVRQLVAPLLPKLQEAATRAQQLVILSQLLPPMAGYPEAKTYLFLLQNNSELRPTGGFIGTYGILKVKDGEIASFQTDNVYNLDGPAEKFLDIRPPAPLAEYLLADRWFLRDANWSPDWPISARKAEWFYQKEGGLEKIDGVIAITPTVISSLLTITGPLEVDGLRFTADNFVEVLQYQVEKGFYQQGRATAERKSVIGDLGRLIIEKLMALPFNRWPEVAVLLKANLDEKQILIYDKNNEAWDFVLANNWAGAVKNTADDYLMVIDANLASLKTDKVVRREIDYSVQPDEAGDLIAKVKITYHNEGEFSWQTTRLRTYTRVYAPVGSELIGADGAMANDRSQEPGEVMVSSELGKTVFGAFIAIEPGQKGELGLEYKLPTALAKKARQGYYNLTIQKQPGTAGHQLLVNLSFNNKIKEFSPTGFANRRIGENNVKFETDLRVDREFGVKLK
ncbi:MAG: DUF4012 domain-containing protein [bacterium]